MTVRTLLVAVAALVVSGFLIARALPRGDAAPQPGRLGVDALEGVSLKELADQGWHLSPPPEGYAPKISGKHAKYVAGEFYRGVPVRQLMLAHLESLFLGGSDNEVWIVNFDPAGVRECPGSANLYTLTFVDAESGQSLYGLSESSASSSPACRHGPHFTTPDPTATPAPGR
jgi:hypothetical protein